MDTIDVKELRNVKAIQYTKHTYEETRAHARYGRSTAMQTLLLLLVVGVDFMSS